MGVESLRFLLVQSRLQSADAGTPCRNNRGSSSIVNPIFFLDVGKRFEVVEFSKLSVMAPSLSFTWKVSSVFGPSLSPLSVDQFKTSCEPPPSSFLF